ncbi:UDP-glucose 4-epimerase [Serratia odorifera]|uniref:UDP-glucose 4-epimerase n=1 Tax=Serratia odorifera TaxID=618 RepID=A0A3S4DR79_SEROD|nr:UDP-glucose 4-epimerase [Serratia odorifera]
MAILVTGGAGYIGSHTVLALLERGENVVVLDNLSNASEVSLHRVEQLTGKAAVFYQGDIQDRVCLKRIFDAHDISSVIHFAGLKAVGESTRKPLEYYQNNVAGTLVLLQAMREAGVHQFIFSSSATVYGANAPVPYVETTPIGGTTSPYGTSKLMVEQILQDFAKAEPAFSIIALRYFNPVGAHPSGLSVKIRTVFLTTCCRTLRKWPSANWRSSVSLAATIRPRMAPGCVITFTLWIWPKGI